MLAFEVHLISILSLLDLICFSRNSLLCATDAAGGALSARGRECGLRDPQRPNPLGRVRETRVCRAVAVSDGVRREIEFGYQAESHSL